jgi:hypothetical protein
VPPCFIIFSLSLGVEDWHHSIVKLRVWLHEIDDVKNVLPMLSRVSNFEVKPLGIVLGIMIWLQN